MAVKNMQKPKDAIMSNSGNNYKLYFKLEGFYLGNHWSYKSVFERRVLSMVCHHAMGVGRHALHVSCRHPHMSWCTNSRVPSLTTYSQLEIKIHQKYENTVTVLLSLSLWYQSIQFEWCLSAWY